MQPNANSNPNQATNPNLQPPAAEGQPQLKPEQVAPAPAPAETSPTGSPAAASPPPQGPAASATSPAPAAQPSTPPSVGPTPAVAGDVDVIEKEWVDQAEKIIKQTQGDPYAEEEAEEVLQQDYLKKRYNHDVKKPDAG